MKNLRTWILLVLMLGVSTFTHAQGPGTTCYTAIPLGKDYKADITGPQTVWYSAWTFDLPLSVYFKPQNENDPVPDVEMDFSCTSGYYTDSILCSLFCASAEGAYVSMPHKPKLNYEYKDGELYYYITMGKTYRDLLLRVGISYNVEVFVKVTYKSSGIISIAPDDMFSSCMDGAKFMQFGDTVRVKPQDKNRHVIVPYVQWQEDSIYYKWSGTSQATLTVATDCKHDPQDGEDESILQRLKIPAGDSVKVPSDKLKNYVKFGEAGMLFAKCYSNSDGVLTVKRVPQAPPRGGATALRYGRRVAINANDTAALYAIPSSWEEEATIFTTPTDHVFRMYIGTEPDFYTKDAIAAYQFLPSDKGHWLGLFAEDMQKLWEQTDEKYLYVRFACTARTSILPEIWSPSECMSKELVSKTTGSITAWKGTFYRFYYYDWVGGDMTMQWLSKVTNCPTYIGDTCFFPAKNDNEHILAYKTIAKNDSWTIKKEDLDTWANRIDPDGYFYVRFEPSKKDDIKISSTAPEEQDPVYPHATIHVECQDGNPNVLTVTVSEPQSITVSGAAAFSEAWDATADAPYTLNLPSGQYRLKGANEEIVLLVP
ncbi:MAG: hypothetical protein II825_04605 [Paludibacteraceae bacterium]|nr:hypothetical protein [Paludibacteraceae bacterium]